MEFMSVTQHKTDLNNNEVSAGLQLKLLISHIVLYKIQ